MKNLRVNSSKEMDNGNDFTYSQERMNHSKRISRSEYHAKPLRGFFMNLFDKKLLFHIVFNPWIKICVSDVREQVHKHKYTNHE